MRSCVRIFGHSLVVLLLLGCRPDSGESSPALLLPKDYGSYDILHNAIFDSVGGMRVESIDGDPTTTSTLIVSPSEPTQYEMNSIFLPVVFELRVKDGNCYMVNKNEQFEVDLPDLECKPA